MNSPLPFAFQSVTGQELDVLRFFTPGRLLSVALILLATSLLIRYAGKLFNLIAARGPRARFIAKLIEPILRITLWFTAIFLSFDLLAPSRETFIAIIGSVAIAIGFGAQDLVKNLVGGLVILTDRPISLETGCRGFDAFHLR